jgi:caffeoyl-CoA O-methyltransferase
MEFIEEALDNYVCEHTSPENGLLQQLNRDTHVKILKPRMLSGHFQGRVLSMLSHMIRPERILEIGTYTGYSALCLAEGLTENGKLITIDVNAEIEDFTRAFFAESKLNTKIDYRIANAMELIPQLDEQFDIVFIDADKLNYINYYHLVFDKVKKGGYILADNVLWSGKVTGDYETLDKDTRLLMDFNKLVQEDDRVENVLLPIRDGIMIARKL